MRRFFNKFSTGIFYFTILLFIIAFNFSDNPPGGWHQQFLPNLNGRIISDMLFTDSLNGYATGYKNFDPNYLIKTTTGGENWFVVDSVVSWLTQLQFLNDSIGYAGGARIFKTTNKGYNWIQVPMPMGVAALGFSVLNEDTILSCFDDNLTGGVFRTTNAGLAWNRFFYQFGQNPNKIYMFDKSIGFFTNGDNLRKTTNGGVNWFGLSGGPFTDIYFIDSLKGWKTNYDTIFQKTIDGGINWIDQSLPQEKNILFPGIGQFSLVGQDTIWGGGGAFFYGMGRARGIIYRTTNGGTNWAFQIPDTSFGISSYPFIEFISSKTGWAYSQTYTGINTKVGGDTTFYTGLQQITSVIPKQFTLKQNYPNPFNPKTVIPFSLKQSAYVKLIAYDVRGVEVQKLAEGKYEAGEYEVDFMGKFSSSGVYFYKIEITTKDSHENFAETKLMMLIK